MTTFAIDASALSSGVMAGIPRYIGELTAALGRLAAPEKLLVLCRGTVEQAPSFPGAETVAAPVPLWLTVWVPYTLIRRHCRLIHFPYAAMPPWLPCRSVVTAHDLAFLRNPDWFSPEMLARLQRTWPAAIRRADHILAVSEFTRREVVELIGVDPTRITVTPFAVADRWRVTPEHDFLSAVNGGRPYVLAVGTIQPRKNYRRLIEAFAAASSQLGQFDLCIVGSRGWQVEDLDALAARLGLDDRVRLLGAVSDDELLAWYHHATALAFVSLYEGTGLPLLEAMAQGVPCLTSSGSALAEVAGDAAELVNPLDVDAIAQGLVRVCQDSELRARLRERGLARVKDFTWERCARTVLEVYRATAQV